MGVLLTIVWISWTAPVGTVMGMTMVRRAGRAAARSTAAWADALGGWDGDARDVDLVLYGGADGT